MGSSGAVDVPRCWLGADCCFTLPSVLQDPPSRPGSGAALPQELLPSLPFQARHVEPPSPDKDVLTRGDSAHSSWPCSCSQRPWRLEEGVWGAEASAGIALYQLSLHGGRVPSKALRPLVQLTGGGAAEDGQ